MLSVCDPRRLKPNGDMLMWSHYGEGHQGCRVHFDEKFLRRDALTSWTIEYGSRLQIVDGDFRPELDNGLGVAAYEKLSLGFRSKGSAWAYEEEVRFFMKRVGADTTGKRIRTS